MLFVANRWRNELLLFDFDKRTHAMKYLDFEKTMYVVGKKYNKRETNLLGRLAIVQFRKALNFTYSEKSRDSLKYCSSDTETYFSPAIKTAKFGWRLSVDSCYTVKRLYLVLGCHFILALLAI